MACFHPLKAYKTTDGRIIFDKGLEFSVPIELACGQCIGCRIQRSQEWATRITHEAQFHAERCFLTLTYANKHLPPWGTLVPRDLTLFLKRLRFAHKDRLIRYFACGEYGENTERPHYHVILFGYSFPDKREHSKNGQGHQQFVSEELDKIWGYGNCLIGSVNWSSAAYVARYTLKKVNGERANEHYRKVDYETGEIHQLEPEFIRMSRRPGIGAQWFERYSGDLYPGDVAVIGGKKKRVPRYYDKQLEKIDPAALADIKSARKASAKKRKADNTPERRAVREEVQKARIQKLKRKI